MDRTIDNPSINASQPETVSVRSRERGPKEIWPNFFIVGAPRAGTSSLYQYLRRVPGVYMPYRKEPHYFGAPLAERLRRKRIPVFAPNLRVRSQAEYLKLFKNVKDEVAVGEASASYLRDPEAPGRIKETVPEARIIMILRDPVERAYSHYLQNVNNGWQRLPFEEAVQLDLYLEPSLYAKQVQKYLDAFGSDHVKVLIFEDFIQEPRKTVSDVLKFLGVHAEPPAIVGKVYNYPITSRWPWLEPLWRSRLGKLVRTPFRILIPRRTRLLIRRQVLYRKASKPPMPEKARRFLEEAFHSDVERLEQILGRSLPWFHARDRLAQDQDKRSAGGTSNAHR